MWPKGLVEEFQRGRLVAVEDLAADERTRAWYESLYQPMGMRAGIFAPAGTADSGHPGDHHVRTAPGTTTRFRWCAGR